ncbi:HlyC/CorC family transporter [Lactonifactor longoviformis]|uniref:Hemolysin, contains CBS domains n=1 Tax=Lactonifactor longoviformis DSM 17459 TaxID=1122155 RepID=A0A1M4ZYD9_9CLOT|nr:hemolysin family protein [Lactonifactor longoviformis]POP31735.1 HlyC/CorC family transporter [Lactonifactor longoviformis]SHF22636.1 Hemolysin, contains CBS domains [Lactonifactor longoviformis DSM 17459]
MNSNSISLAIIVICIIMSAYFSATETAFSSLNRIRVKNMADKGNKRAELVLKLAGNYDGMLSTILIGNNIVNIACASIATVLFVKLLGEDMGASVSTVATTIVVLIFGEVSPKSIAKESPEKFAMFSAPFLKGFMVVLTPFNFLFRQWKKFLSKLVKTSEDRSITEEELLTIVEEAEQDGGIGTQESDLIRNAIEFTEVEAGDILTPRVDVVAVSIEDSRDSIAGAFADSGFSRLPVYLENIDQIVGILYQKDFYNYVYHTDEKLENIVRRPLFITKTKKINILLKELQAAKSHIAVVIDEFGGTVGIVTLEDILEELVGEIWDEHDKVVMEIEKEGEGVYTVLGSTNAERFFEELDREEELEVTTVSGWVMDELGKIPEEGEQFQFENLKITVLKMSGRRVEKIRVEVLPQIERAG